MVALTGKTWALAPSLVALVKEADVLAPNRSTISDGSIGDAAHSARTSDHNPADDPNDNTTTRWVCAVDLTDDDAGGMDVRPFFAHLVETRDPRVKYLIHEARIVKAYARNGVPAWQWQPYTGVNAHKQHGHVSIWNTASARNDISSWFDTTIHETTEGFLMALDDDAQLELLARVRRLTPFPHETINRNGEIVTEGGVEADPTVRWTIEMTRLLRRFADTEALAVAISAKLSGAGSTVTQGMLEDALRNVLGGLDE